MEANAVDQCKLSHTMTIVFLLAHLVAASAQAPPLRIVVLEGEDAVNVIQHKTAVAPVIEVRDRNDVPVSGAIVTFTLGGNTASFAGGVQTFTIATNAAGQAAAAAINPLASGAVQIQVAAAFQGQTAAATIVQTNVLTAAQAAAATGATGAGASSGSAGGTTTATGGGASGGGGLSGTTLGIIGAAAAGGAVVAARSGDEPPAAPRTLTGRYTSTITLTFTGCTRVESWAGLLTITLTTTEPIAGDARITESTTRVEAVTCTGGPQLGATGTASMPSTPVTGTASNLGFAYEATNVFPPGPNEVGGTNTSGFRFTGTLAGAEMTGTLTHTRQITSNAGDRGAGSASVAVTLR